MKLTGKCKEDFEKWLQEHIIFCTVDDLLYWFYEQPSMMQYGVYVDFFDSVGVNIDNGTLTYPLTNNFFFSIKDYIRFFKSRQEAREQAIIKANEIYNEQN